MTFWAVTGGIEDVQEDIEREFGLRNGDDEPSGLLEWMRMRIPVDDTPTDFQVIAGRSTQWGAVGSVGDVVVGVEVVNFAMADVVLETIADIEPYLKGRRAQ